MRFYRPASGEILIDGKPIDEIDLSWIRNNITLLEQKSVLFNDSVFRNIAFGSKNHQEITGYDVEVAIDMAMLQDTIDSPPQKLDTCVGPGGSFLSGGQRQRVAIARARLRDTPILILDEPTSALDRTNRLAIMKAIREWRKRKTTIIITHDMSQILEDDFVYVLEEGHIAHSGYRQEIEKQSGAESYFQSNEKADWKDKKKLERHISEASGFYQDLEDGLGDLPHLPPRARQENRQTWAQHHLPPGLRSSTIDIASIKHSVSPSLSRSDESTRTNPNTRKKRLSRNQRVSQRTQLPSQGWLKSLQAAPEEVEMGEIQIHFPDIDRVREISNEDDSQVPNQSQETKRQRISRRLSPRERNMSRSSTKDKPTPLSQIMGTVFPNLTSKQRVVLILGILSSLTHASATPIFSFCLSKLFTTFYAGSDSARLSMVWSLAVLGVSFGDGLASFFMHYFLEFSGEAWMDTIRNRAFKRILDQPRAWFESEGNSPSRLTAYLDQNGEDMRNLLGRFAGYVIVAVSITVMAIIWSLVMCWKLTLVAFACGPFIYAITRGFEAANGVWERRTNAANNIVFDIFTETFSEIRTVRTLTLERYFHQKHTQAMSRSLTVGLKRAVYTGMLFGMVESVNCDICEW